MKVPAAPDQPLDSPAAPPEPTAPPPPAVATWPAWVKSADAAMVFLVLIAAFLLASNVARNTDQWLYFASGRALLNGEYSLGSDPFSHATAGRTWVNHSWLSSVAAYVLYRADLTGFVVVAVKAFLFAATFGIVTLIRRPGKPIWPWVFVTAIAVVAAAPHAMLRPIVASGLFLAVTLYLYLKRDWRHSRRLHLILTGILFWLWASSDAWFFLGPLTILVVLIGEIVQQRFWKIRETDEEPSSLPISHLILALAVGVLACSLTPHHLRVWQLPAELGFHLPTNYQLDMDLGSFTVSPTDQKNYISRNGRGNSPNGMAYAALLMVGGLVVAVTGLSRLRVAYVLLWIVFAGLSLMQQRLILLFAIVAVPVFATGLSALIEGISLGAPDKPRTSLLLLLSSVGRILGLPAALLFVAASYPGWLHPQPSHPSLTPRVAWAVEADPGLKRTAEVLNKWRESGKLPPEYRGLIVNFDLANHIAWFAPKEKVFANSRFAFHGPELVDLVKIRRIFLDTQTAQPIDNVDVETLEEFCEKNELIYVAYTGIGSPPLPVNTRPLERLSTFHNYALWHIDGRAIVLGNGKSKQYKSEHFRDLAFSPVRQAFHPDNVTPFPPAPPGKFKDSREPSFLDDFLQDLPKPPPQETLDAYMWSYIADAHSEFDFQLRTGGRVQIPDGSIRITGWPWVAGAVGNPILASAAQSGGYRTSDIAVAYNVLALRAVWQAIAANPDDPEAYYRLAEIVGPGQRGVAGRNRAAGRNTIPGLETRRQLEIAGLRQFVDRLPPPELTARNSAPRCYEAVFELYQHYQPDEATQQGQSVLPEPALPMLLLARKYFEMGDPALRKPEETEQRKKEFEARVKLLEEMLIPVNNNFQQFKTLELHAQVRGALERNLVVQAIDKFNEALRTKSFGPEPQQLTLLIVRSHIMLGQTDIADAYLRELEDLNEEGKGKGDPKAEELARVIENFRLQLWQLRGDYAKAGEAMEKTARLPPMTDAEKALVRTAFGKPTPAEYQAHTHRVFLMSLVGGPGVFGELHNQRIRDAIAKWVAHMDFYLQRGLMLMLEGKSAEAKTRFQQALKPEGIDMPAFLPQRLTAEQYLRLMEQGIK